MNKTRKFLLGLTCFSALSVLTVGHLQAAVILIANTSTINVMPGDSFSVTLSMTGSGGDQITGLDYYWRITNVSGSLVGEVSLTNREMGASPFSDPYFSDAVVKAAPGNLLDPQNNSDLGASLDDVNSPLSNGTWLVASFTFTVSPSAVAGEVATLNTFSNLGEGWVGPGPMFEGADFDSQASITVNVIPEPSTCLLFGLAFAFVCWRSRPITATEE